MSIEHTLTELVAPFVSDAGLELWDLEFNGSLLRIIVDGPNGVQVGALQKITRGVSNALDEQDPISGSYRLEVSSPGVERELRKVDHYVKAVGEQVSVKTIAGLEGPRRFKGDLIGADDEGILVRVTSSGDDDDSGDAGDRGLDYDEIEKARTVFDWGPTPKKPGGGSPKKGSSKKGSQKGQQGKGATAAGKSGKTSGGGKKKGAKGGGREHATSNGAPGRETTSEQKRASA